ncbi:hypothetical protein H6F62_11250 [Anabaena sp. FACHB-1391]|uniref:hypothetical protein n=1 Tax=Anabaena sp. FACHB-1391 TaxID=2692771 RepID=UPI0016808FF4|nr:hypothetical protein [Anabaena sp. FACHB-1391]MBD2269327.1 hypothetical protein [Anabaena sp. FACHB-1391]
MSHYSLNNRPLLRPKSDKISVTKILWVICLVLAFIGLSTPNPSETFLGCLIWPVLFSLLWRPGEPPALLFAASFQSLQVFVPVITANLAGETLKQNFGQELSLAFYLGILSMLALAYGMKQAVGASPVISFIDQEKSASELKVSRLAIAYLGTFVFSSLITSLAFGDPAFTQLLLSLGYLRWLVIFLILWNGFRDPKFGLLSLSIVILEIIIGMTGFFSGFKQVLFVMLVVYGATSFKVKQLLRPQVLILMVLLLLLTTYWQSVKGGYRNYVNQGTQTQTVRVSLADRLNYHANEFSKISDKDLEDGFNSGLSRLGYLRFFAGSIRTVPNAVPYQNGKLWSEAISTLIPRALFPDKPILDDSKRTNEFSGIQVSGADKGTSISIGYVGESYIDFGVPFMFAPIFALGYFWGWLYRFITNLGSIPLLGLAAATTILLNSAVFFESSNVKVLPSGVILLLVYSMALRLFGKNIWLWLTCKSELN